MGFKNKKHRERGREREEREKNKEVKKQGQYTRRNVVLQTAELAKLKCTGTMGTLGEKRREKRLTMKYRKWQRQYVLFKLHPVSRLSIQIKTVV